MNTRPTTYLIYVPQGRTVRITRESQAMGITGAYSDAFSICHLAIVIGENGLSYTHADTKTLKSALDTEIAWAGNECKKFLFYRNGDDTTYLEKVTEHKQIDSRRFIIDERLLKNKKGSESLWQHTVVKSGIDGIAAYLDEAKDYFVDKRISTFSEDQMPASLLLHPDQRKFEAVHKFEELFCVDSSEERLKVGVIFDGRHWVGIPDYELKPHHSNPALIESRLAPIGKTTQYMKMFCSIKDVFTTMKKQLAGSGGRVVDTFDPLSSFLKLTPYLQSYFLTKSTPEEIFLNDFAETLDDIHQQPVSDSDKKLKSNLQEEKSIEKIKTLINACHCSKESEYTIHILGHFNQFLRFYQIRKIFDHSLKVIQEKRAKAVSVQKTVKKLLAENKHEESAQAFVESLPEVRIGFVEYEMYLRLVYTNIVTCYINSDKPREALKYLEIELALLKKFNNKDAEIADVNKKITACRLAVDVLEKKQTQIINKLGIEFRQNAAKKSLPESKNEDFRKSAKNALVAGVFWDASSNGNTALHWALIKKEFGKAIILLEEESKFLKENPSCQKKVVTMLGENKKYPIDMLDFQQVNDLFASNSTLIELLGIKKIDKLADVTAGMALL